MSPINKKLIKRTLRYVFFIAIACWVLISVYIGYQYVWFSSTTISTKGWTFVEWIFDKTSYLPYLSKDYQSTFYQGLLFDSCISSSASWSVAGDLCRVWTEDNQNFVIALNKWFIRSDGTPVSIEDLYFTYNDIIRNNKWNISWLSPYKDLIITKWADNKLTIVFPSPSKENISFFTHYILPQHILREYDLDNYKSLFGVNPVYTNCANLVTDSVDTRSLIFNLANCTDTHLNFYQVKNTLSFDTFKQNTKNADKTIVDAYVGQETIWWYTSKTLISNKLVTVFFNTNSDKLRVRTRRVLGGLIKHNFYTTGYENFLKKNTDGLFDVFQSTGVDIKDFINRDYSDGWVTKADLEDSNVKILPNTVARIEEGQKNVYFVDSWTAFPLTFTFGTTYDRISLEYKGKAYPLTYTTNKKTAVYTISNVNGNFGTGLNKYTLYGYVKKAKKTIWTLDIYNILPTTTAIADEVSGNIQNKVLLTVIYYDSPLYNFIIERMQNIFRSNGIIDNFSFEKIATPEELQGRLFAGDYDILVSVADMGETKNFTKLFGTDQSEFNPSQYQNKPLISLLWDYMRSNSSKQLHEINATYSRDMPFVILGNVFTKLNIEESLAAKFFATGTNIDESNRRNIIYQKLELVSNIHIDGKKVRSWSNFVKFLNNSLK